MMSDSTPDVDPMGHVVVGDPDPNPDGPEKYCSAPRHGPHFRCTRQPHPERWQHIAGDGENVLAVWTDIVSGASGWSKTTVVIAYGYPTETTSECTCRCTDIGIGIQHEQGCDLRLVMPLAELVTLIQQGGLALPEPDRWIRTTNGRAPVPVWDSDIKNVIAWPDGVEAIPGGFNDYPEELEHYALAMLAAVRYTRQSAAETPGGERR